MSDIFQEVDEAVRHEEYLKLWKKYRYAIIGVVLAIVVAVAGYDGWKNYSAEQRKANSERYAAAIEALNGADEAAAESALGEVVEAAPSGYGVLASFRLAEQKDEAGDTAGAVAELEALANRSGVPQPLRDIASFQAILYQADEGDPAALEGALAPLAREGSALRPSALELTAFLALKQGETARARETFQQLAEDPATPSGIRRRATQMLAQIGE